MSRVAATYLPEANAASIDVDTLWDFVPAISPTFTAPTHLHQLADCMRDACAAARGEGPPVFVCSSIPPQHGKTEFYLHSLAYWLLRQPSDFLAYLSYNQDISDDKSAKVRRYAELAGVDIRNDTRSKKLWRTTSNGGLMAGGIVGGSVTGREALKCLVIDDPYRNRSDAESRVIRDKVWAEFNDSVWTRLHTGTSVFVNHTRWHPDDLIGRIKKDPELSKVFRFINFPVITRGGDPLHTDDFDVLWPEVQTPQLIKRKRQGSSDYAWWSLYMGEPRPRDTQVFSDGFGFFTEYPPHARIAIGVDFAYTAKTSSDWSVAVVMATDGAERYYVLDVVRRQCAAPDFAAEVAELQRRYPGAPTMAYVGGTERGVVDYMAREGLRIDARPATADKFIRAQPFSTAWNRGQVYLPDRPVSWREDYLACLLDFTGNNDPHDDDVDASAAAFDALATAGVSGVYIPERSSTAPRRMSRPKRLGRRGGVW